MYRIVFLIEAKKQNDTFRIKEMVKVVEIPQITFAFHDIFIGMKVYDPILMRN